MILNLKLIIKNIALISVAGLPPTKELWKSTIKNEHVCVVRYGFVLVETL
jgi:hypothetical protein